MTHEPYGLGNLKTIVGDFTQEYLEGKDKRWWWPYDMSRKLRLRDGGGSIKARHIYLHTRFTDKPAKFLCFTLYPKAAANQRRKEKAAIEAIKKALEDDFYGDKEIVTQILAEAGIHAGAENPSVSLSQLLTIHRVAKAAAREIHRQHRKQRKLRKRRELQELQKQQRHQAQLLSAEPPKPQKRLQKTYRIRDDKPVGGKGANQKDPNVHGKPRASSKPKNSVSLLVPAQPNAPQNAVEKTHLADTQDAGNRFTAALEKSGAQLKDNFKQQDPNSARFRNQSFEIQVPRGSIKDLHESGAEKPVGAPPKAGQQQDIDSALSALAELGRGLGEGGKDGRKVQFNAIRNLRPLLDKAHVWANKEVQNQAREILRLHSEPINDTCISFKKANTQKRYLKFWDKYNSALDAHSSGAQLEPKKPAAAQIGPASKQKEQEQIEEAVSHLTGLIDALSDDSAKGRKAENQHIRGLRTLLDSHHVWQDEGVKELTDSLPTPEERTTYSKRMPRTYKNFARFQSQLMVARYQNTAEGTSQLIDRLRESIAENIGSEDDAGLTEQRALVESLTTRLWRKEIKESNVVKKALRQLKDEVWPEIRSRAATKGINQEKWEFYSRLLLMQMKKGLKLSLDDVNDLQTPKRDDTKEEAPKPLPASAAGAKNGGVDGPKSGQAIASSVAQSGAVQSVAKADLPKNESDARIEAALEHIGVLKAAVAAAFAAHYLQPLMTDEVKDAAAGLKQRLKESADVRENADVKGALDSLMTAASQGVEESAKSHGISLLESRVYLNVRHTMKRWLGDISAPIDERITTLEKSIDSSMKGSGHLFPNGLNDMEQGEVAKMVTNRLYGLAQDAAILENDTRMTDAAKTLATFKQHYENATQSPLDLQTAKEISWTALDVRNALEEQQKQPSFASRRDYDTARQNYANLIGACDDIKYVVDGFIASASAPAASQGPAIGAAVDRSESPSVTDMEAHLSALLQALENPDQALTKEKSADLETRLLALVKNEVLLHHPKLTPLLKQVAEKSDKIVPLLKDSSGYFPLLTAFNNFSPIVRRVLSNPRTQEAKPPQVDGSVQPDADSKEPASQAEPEDPKLSPKQSTQQKTSEKTFDFFADEMDEDNKQSKVAVNKGSAAVPDGARSLDVEGARTHLTAILEVLKKPSQELGQEELKKLRDSLGELLANEEVLGRSELRPQLKSISRKIKRVRTLLKTNNDPELKEKFGAFWSVVNRIRTNQLKNEPKPRKPKPEPQISDRTTAEPAADEENVQAGGSVRPKAGADDQDKQVDISEAAAKAAQNQLSEAQLERERVPAQKRAENIDKTKQELNRILDHCKGDTSLEYQGTKEVKEALQGLVGKDYIWKDEGVGKLVDDILKNHGEKFEAWVNENAIGETHPLKVVERHLLRVFADRWDAIIDAKQIGQAKKHLETLLNSVRKRQTLTQKQVNNLDAGLRALKGKVHVWRDPAVLELVKELVSVKSKRDLNDWLKKLPDGVGEGLSEFKYYLYEIDDARQEAEEIAQDVENAKAADHAPNLQQSNASGAAGLDNDPQASSAPKAPQVGAQPKVAAAADPSLDENEAQKLGADLLGIADEFSAIFGNSNDPDGDHTFNVKMAQSVIDDILKRDGSKKETLRRVQEILGPEGSGNKTVERAMEEALAKMNANCLESMKDSEDPFQQMNVRRTIESALLGPIKKRFERIRQEGQTAAVIRAQFIVKERRQQASAQRPASIPQSEQPADDGADAAQNTNVAAQQAQQAQPAQAEVAAKKDLSLSDHEAHQLAKNVLAIADEFCSVFNDDYDLQDRQEFNTVMAQSRLEQIAGSNENGGKNNEQTLKAARLALGPSGTGNKIIEEAMQQALVKIRERCIDRMKNHAQPFLLFTIRAKVEEALLGSINGLEGTLKATLSENKRETRRQAAAAKMAEAPPIADAENKNANLRPAQSVAANADVAPDDQTVEQLVSDVKQIGEDFCGIFDELIGAKSNVEISEILAKAATLITAKLEEDDKYYKLMTVHTLFNEAGKAHPKVEKAMTDVLHDIEKRVMKGIEEHGNTTRQLVLQDTLYSALLGPADGNVRKGRLGEVARQSQRDIAAKIKTAHEAREERQKADAAAEKIQSAQLRSEVQDDKDEAAAAQVQPADEADGNDAQVPASSQPAKAQPQPASAVPKQAADVDAPKRKLTQEQRQDIEKAQDQLLELWTLTTKENAEVLTDEQLGALYGKINWLPLNDDIWEDGQVRERAAKLLFDVDRLNKWLDAQTAAQAGRVRDLFEALIKKCDAIQQPAKKPQDDKNPDAHGAEEEIVELEPQEDAQENEPEDVSNPVQADEDAPKIQESNAADVGGAQDKNRNAPAFSEVNEPDAKQKAAAIADVPLDDQRVEELVSDVKQLGEDFCGFFDKLIDQNLGHDPRTIRATAASLIEEWLLEDEKNLKLKAVQVLFDRPEEAHQAVEKAMADVLRDIATHAMERIEEHGGTDLQLVVQNALYGALLGPADGNVRQSSLGVVARQCQIEIATKIQAAGEAQRADAEAKEIPGAQQKEAPVIGSSLDKGTVDWLAKGVLEVAEDFCQVFDIENYDPKKAKRDYAGEAEKRLSYLQRDEYQNGKDNDTILQLIHSNLGPNGQENEIIKKAMDQALKNVRERCLRSMRDSADPNIQRKILREVESALLGPLKGQLFQETLRENGRAALRENKTINAERIKAHRERIAREIGEVGKEFCSLFDNLTTGHAELDDEKFRAKVWAEVEKALQKDRNGDKLNSIQKELKGAQEPDSNIAAALTKVLDDIHRRCIDSIDKDGYTDRTIVVRDALCDFLLQPLKKGSIKDHESELRSALSEKIAANEKAEGPALVQPVAPASAAAASGNASPQTVADYIEDIGADLCTLFGAESGRIGVQGIGTLIQRRLDDKDLKAKLNQVYSALQQKDGIPELVHEAMTRTLEDIARRSISGLKGSSNVMGRLTIQQAVQKMLLGNSKEYGQLVEDCSAETLAQIRMINRERTEIRDAIDALTSLRQMVKERDKGQLKKGEPDPRKVHSGRLTELASKLNGLKGLDYVWQDKEVSNLVRDIVSRPNRLERWLKIQEGPPIYRAEQNPLKQPPQAVQVLRDFSGFLADKHLEQAAQSNAEVVAGAAPKNEQAAQFANDIRLIARDLRHFAGEVTGLDGNKGDELAARKMILSLLEVNGHAPKLKAAKAALNSGARGYDEVRLAMKAALTGVKESCIANVAGGVNTFSQALILDEIDKALTESTTGFADLVQQHKNELTLAVGRAVDLGEFQAAAVKKDAEVAKGLSKGDLGRLTKLVAGLAYEGSTLMKDGLQGEAFKEQLNTYLDVGKRRQNLRKLQDLMMKKNFFPDDQRKTIVDAVNSAVERLTTRGVRQAKESNGAVLGDYREALMALIGPMEEFNNIVLNGANAIKAAIKKDASQAAQSGAQNAGPQSAAKTEVSEQQQAVDSAALEQALGDIMTRFKEIFAIAVPDEDDEDAVEGAVNEGIAAALNQNRSSWRKIETAQGLIKDGKGESLKQAFVTALKELGEECVERVNTQDDTTELAFAMDLLQEKLLGAARGQFESQMEANGEMVEAALKRRERGGAQNDKVQEAPAAQLGLFQYTKNADDYKDVIKGLLKLSKNWAQLGAGNRAPVSKGDVDELVKALEEGKARGGMNAKLANYIDETAKEILTQLKHWDSEVLSAILPEKFNEKLAETANNCLIYKLKALEKQDADRKGGPAPQGVVCGTAELWKGWRRDVRYNFARALTSLSESAALGTVGKKTVKHAEKLAHYLKDNDTQNRPITASDLQNIRRHALDLAAALSEHDRKSNYKEYKDVIPKLYKVGKTAESLIPHKERKEWLVKGQNVGNLFALDNLSTRDESIQDDFRSYTTKYDDGSLGVPLAYPDSKSEDLKTPVNRRIKLLEMAFSLDFARPGSGYIAALADADQDRSFRKDLESVGMYEQVQRALRGACQNAINLLQSQDAAITSDTRESVRQLADLIQPGNKDYAATLRQMVGI